MERLDEKRRCFKIMRVRNIVAALFALALFAVPCRAQEEKVRIGVFQFES